MLCFSLCLLPLVVALGTNYLLEKFPTNKAWREGPKKAGYFSVISSSLLAHPSQAKIPADVFVTDLLQAKLKHEKEAHTGRNTEILSKHPGLRLGKPKSNRMQSCQWSQRQLKRSSVYTLVAKGRQGKGGPAAEGGRVQWKDKVLNAFFALVFDSKRGPNEGKAAIKILGILNEG